MITQVTHKLSPDEVKEAITEYLLKRNIKVSSIVFTFREDNQEGDWRSEYATETSLDSAICKGIQE